MPFDPDKPAANTPLNSQEMRDQLTALKALIDAIPAGPQGPPGEVTFPDLNNAISGTAQNPGTVATLSLTVSDPLVAADVQLIVDKVNELINALKRV